MHKQINIKVLHIILICLTIGAIYLPSLGGEFLMDDIPFVKENPFIREFHGPIDYLLQEDGTVGNAPHAFHFGYYRPLVNVTFTLDYRVWGMNARGFRASNILFHMAVCILLYSIVCSLIGRASWEAFWVSLLFAVHPANTEAVSWITSRNNMLAALFTLAAFHLSVQGRKTPSPFLRWIALLFFAAALLSKEFALMLLPILFVYERLMGESAVRWKEILTYIVFGVVILAYLGLRKVAIAHFITPHAMISLGKSLLFVPYIIIYYIRIIFIPSGLHNFTINYPETIFSVEFFIGMVGGVLLFLFIWGIRTHRWLLFAWLSFLIGLFPVLNIFPTASHTLVSMRWLYVPLAFLAMGSGVWFARVKNRNRSLTHILGVLLVLYLGASTALLNQHHWKNGDAFFEAEAVIYGNDRYYGDLAKSYQSRGFHHKAEEYYRKAIEAGPQRTYLLIDYSSLLLEMGLPERALFFLNSALTGETEPKDRAGLYNNQGVAYSLLKNYERAIAFFRKAVIMAPDNEVFQSNLKRAYREAEED